MPQPESVLSHISLGTNDYPRAKAFYDAVLATLGIRCLMEHGPSAGYGKGFPDFWIGLPHDGGRAAVGNGTHVCFVANSQEEVQAFHAKALQLGAHDDGGPGIRPEYSPRYYAAFVHDPDGHKIEAVYLLPQGTQ
ncbi:VOC family protein [Ramlibacter humi]|uniref:VOC family protein n=1 Tax=Ramlibacter humi TaxID=2530451 RepID=A0A4Z0BU30_9BURK|nr:VOC family protein [Ramlibacter humi]TFZ01910.1 VOC family protein [Ramlibacter humi]